MPRGFKRDAVETKRQCFLDKRSFVSIDGHKLLYGDDKVIMRGCILMYRNPLNLAWDEGEWHHLRNKHNDFRRCDCLEGGIFISKAQHRKQHVQVQLGKIPEGPRKTSG